MYPERAWAHSTAISNTRSVPSLRYMLTEGLLQDQQMVELKDRLNIVGW